MKVVRVIARLNVGGPARHVVWLTAGLKDRFDTLLVAGTVPPGEDDMSYFAEQHGVAPYIIPEMSREISPKDVLTVWKLYKLFLRERPDIVHTHTAKAGTAGRVAGFAYRWMTPSVLIGRPRRCRFVHTYHGHVFHSYYGTWKTRVFLGIEKVLARVVTDRLIVISPQQLREIQREFRVGRESQFAVVPLGLDLTMFSDWRAHRNKLRTELQSDDDEILVGIVGRLTEIKNHRLFLEVAARFRALGCCRGRRVRFVVVGDGNMRDELLAQASSLALKDAVEFLGTRNDPQDFYPALDVVALTSLNEGTPLTLIEAMANERPCIATAVGGVTDLLGERLHDVDDNSYTICKRGVLVQSGNVDGFVAGLSRLIEDVSLRKDLGSNGREFVRENYSRERLLNDIGRLYEELTGAHPGVARDVSAVGHEVESTDFTI